MHECVVPFAAFITTLVEIHRNKLVGNNFLFWCEAKIKVVATMWFVVYLKKLNKNVILPESWIKDIGDHYEKFMNYSVNSSQSFLCYYTTNQAAFDMNNQPNVDFEADFSSNMVTEMNSDGTFNGCFIGKIKKCKCKYIV